MCLEIDGEVEDGAAVAAEDILADTGKQSKYLLYESLLIQTTTETAELDEQYQMVCVKNLSCKKTIFTHNSMP